MQGTALSMSLCVFRRSRRKGDGKENLATGGEISGRKTGSWDERERLGSRPRQSSGCGAEFSVCDAISEQDFRQLVLLPDAMDLNEWLASHSKRQTLQYSTILHMSVSYYMYKHGRGGTGG